MSKTETITLQQPLTAHGKTITQIEVREPKASEFFALGDPQIIGRNPDGTIYAVEDEQKTRAYIEKCVDIDPLLLSQLSLADAMNLKQVLFNFFLSARAAI